MSWVDLYPAIAEVYLLIAVLILLLLGLTGTTPQITRITWMSIAAIAGTVILQLLNPSKGSVIASFGGLMSSDKFVLLLKNATMFGVFLSLLAAIDEIRVKKTTPMALPFEFPILVLFSSLGMLVMIGANDLMTMYMGLELHSLPLAIMIAMDKGQIKSSEAAVKYFILGAVASGFVLFGISLVYGFAGSTNFVVLEKALMAQNMLGHVGIKAGLLFMLAGLSFKLAIVPFHMWAPDVYEGSPSPVTLFIAGAPKIAALALLMKLLFGVFATYQDFWQPILIGLSSVSMLVGAAGAIAQRNIKRLLAYSSIGHMGYALVGFVAAGIIGAQSIMMYIFIYVISLVGVFAILMSLRKARNYPVNIDDLKGLSTTHPLQAFAMAVFLLSMAGIPPLAGFLGKFYVFMAAIHSGFYPLAVLGVVISVIGAYYYLNIIRIMYFETAEESSYDSKQALVPRLIMMLAMGFTLVFIFSPTWLSQPTFVAAETMLTYTSGAK